ncbi:MAG TPA: folylpolyglutamate synthase/dihydrofolate synthase family protein [Gemmataceae bacterium]|nr:folylpolyglutamate synthase/dihydrofolate synthase family protein [Gemmataceae bacterium]
MYQSVPLAESRPMTYEEAIQFWFGRVNYEHRSPGPSDLKLDRMHALLERLGNPHQTLRIIHVAGSKGKGSTSAMLAAILRQAGYRTGLFTSPHLSAIEERIQVDGSPISRNELAAIMTEVRPFVEEMDQRQPAGAIGVTFFEIATAVGFLHFARRRTEAVVLEVGLGGRFDSTNVCRPALAIITSISHDHTEQLGNTLASIAFEKAGIVKRGRPTLSGARDPEARAVIQRICRERASPLRELDVDIHYNHLPGEITAETTRLPRVRITTSRRPWPEMELGLLGEHQAANAALAVAAVEELRQQGMHIGDAAVANGVAHVDWPARLEVVSRRPLVVLDCAHNIASIEALNDTLRQSFPPAAGTNGNVHGGRRLLIFACSNDKDVAGIVQLLAPHFAHAFMTRYTKSRRGVPPEQLVELWRRSSDHPATACATPAEAWQAARAAAQPHDLICITGSVYLAGELRAAFG